MFIGYRLQKLRKKRKITQKVLAEKTGISRSYLSDIEHNRYNPSFDTIESLAASLKLNLKEFFDDELLEDDYFLEPLKEESNEDEVEELSENTIIEKDIVPGESTSMLSKKEILKIEKDLEKILANLDNFEKNISIEDNLLDPETRQLFKESLENSMKMAKMIAKHKFSSKSK